MFLYLISLPRILREDVSTNIKDTVWTAPALPHHLPHLPSPTWWVPSAHLRILRFIPSPLPPGFPSYLLTHYQRGKGPIKFEGWQKITLIICSPPQFARLSLLVWGLSTLLWMFEWPQSRWKWTNWSPHTRHTTQEGYNKEEIGYHASWYQHHASKITKQMNNYITIIWNVTKSSFVNIPYPTWAHIRHVVSDTMQTSKWGGGGNKTISSFLHSVLLLQGCVAPQPEPGSY